MRIWLVCFGVLFALYELYEWGKDLTLPFPVYIVGGAFLAIASNYNKLAAWYWRESVTDSTDKSNNQSNTISEHSLQSIPFTIRNPDKSLK